MESSAEVLLVGGTVVLLYGFILGVPMAQARMKSPAAPRHLLNTHLEALMAGAALLGLSLAVTFSTLTKNLELLWGRLAAGPVATLRGGTLNRWMSIDDPFTAKSPGF